PILWVMNALIVRGSLADAQQLAGRTDVAAVRGNRLHAMPVATAQGSADFCSPDAPNNPICWNIRAIGAERVWADLGVRGRGIVLANIDTGVAINHPSLAGSYRGNRGGGFYSDDYSWYDPQGRLLNPADIQGHGTHTMGTMVATPEQGAPYQFGVAPGARWIAAQGCEENNCSDADLMQSAQWMLAPTKIDGSDPRPDLRPHIISNSWASEETSDWYAPYTAAWRAAGIFPVFAAGNAIGPADACGSIASPGDAADVVAVGATSIDGQLASYSLLGPTSDGRMKPDFSAPGSSVFSTLPPENRRYGVLSGTSMAAPHVAATVALLWEANPSLIGDYDATYALLRETADQVEDTRCGGTPGGQNNAYGHGRLNAYAAVARARVDVPWLDLVGTLPPVAGGDTLPLVLNVDTARLPGPGVYQARVLLYGADLTRPLDSIPLTVRVASSASDTVITGQVREQGTGAPLQAQVALARDGTRGLPITTERDGRFTLTVATGVAYQLTATALGYLPQTYPVDSQSSRLDLQLSRDQPILIAPTTPITAALDFAETTELLVPIENRGTRPLHYQLTIPSNQFQVTRSDLPGGPQYAWIDLPADAARLPADEDGFTAPIPLGFTFPFYSFTITDVVLTGDGMLAVDSPFVYSGPTSNCMPDEWLPFYVIAPLRADLDLSSGGQARYGLVDGRFVLSYENVPLQYGQASETFTFQVILAPDGRIVFQYKQLAALPTRASVGIQRTPTTLQQIGCGPTTPVSNGLAIELSPQPDSTLWMSSDRQRGVVAPGERGEVPVRLAWMRPAPGLAYLEGQLLLTTNDVRNPSASVNIRMNTRAAPYEQRLLIVGR
ncbi:MAG: S8 family serine peptidase, partial [Chloroflexales bacterium]|nr:S8 family serine peptidase [Chloroflexales bacterium]